jgi:predicted amidohydrolase
MDNHVVVAAVQYKPELLDVWGNLAKAQQMAFEAAAKGAKVIVLPELCISGIALSSESEAADCCQQKGGYQSAAFVPITTKFNCHIVFGYVEVCDGKFYNSAAVIGPRGLEGNFRKKNLWGPDNLWAEPDESVVSRVITAAGRLGVLICRDVMNHYRQSYQYNNSEPLYGKGSIDTVALLTAWGESYGYPDSSWIELAEELRSNVIVSNRVGTERDLSFKGGACVISRPFGNDAKGKIWTHGSSFTESAVVGGIAVL